jgi:hypothetical protein
MDYVFGDNLYDKMPYHCQSYKKSAETHLIFHVKYLLLFSNLKKKYVLKKFSKAHWYKDLLKPVQLFSSSCSGQPEKIMLKDAFLQLLDVTAEKHIRHEMTMHFGGEYMFPFSPS